MDDVCLMRRLHAARQECNDAGRLFWQHRRAVDLLRETAASAEFEREIGLSFVLAYCVDLDDSRVFDACNGLRRPGHRR